MFYINDGLYQTCVQDAEKPAQCCKQYCCKLLSSLHILVIIDGILLLRLYRVSNTLLILAVVPGVLQTP